MSNAPTLLPVADLVAYEKNSRTHSPAQVTQLAGSIDQFGLVGAIVVRGRTIAKGHGTLTAVRKILSDGGRVYPAPGRHAGAEPFPAGMVPVLDVSGWSDTQFRAYVIADNQLALQAGWDEELLKEELHFLSEADFDVAVVGFEDDELARLLGQAPGQGLTDPDAAPPVAEGEPISRRGDVWLLGPHRLRCGDSTNAADVQALLAGLRPNLMVTDPPYGVEYDPAWRKSALNAGEGTATGVVANDDRADWRQAWALFPGNVAYVWHGALHAHTVAESLVASKFKPRAQIVWVKTRPVISRGHYHWQHEAAFYAVRDGDREEWQQRFEDEHSVGIYAVREGGTGDWHGDRKQSTVWYIEHLKNDTGHGTQKPVECMKRPILNNSSPGMAVYEPFSGSGSTLIACEQTGRICLAMELTEKYVDVAVRRWQEFKGQQAFRESDGASFDSLVAARGPAA